MNLGCLLGFEDVVLNVVENRSRTPRKNVVRDHFSPV
jgi:hypothetical protein